MVFYVISQPYSQTPRRNVKIRGVTAIFDKLKCFQGNDISSLSKLKLCLLQLL